MAEIENLTVKIDYDMQEVKDAFTSASPCQQPPHASTERKPMNLRTLWHSLHVRRWHTNPHLSHTHDYTTAHGARMAVLAQKLWPEDDALVRDCVNHDLGENGSGDIPWDAKRENPDLAAAAWQAERNWLDAANLSAVMDDPRVKLLDRVDAYLWAQLHRPDITYRADWAKARREIWEMTADDADLQREILRLICDTERRA